MNRYRYLRGLRLFVCVLGCTSEQLIVQDFTTLSMKLLIIVLMKPYKAMVNISMFGSMKIILLPCVMRDVVFLLTSIKRWIVRLLKSSWLFSMPEVSLVVEATRSVVGFTVLGWAWSMPSLLLWTSPLKEMAKFTTKTLLVVKSSMT